MAKTALYILLATTAVSAIQVGIAPPAATSFIYRNDNNGPASYVQLGAPAPYHAAHDAFAAPLPLAQPIKAFEAYDLHPVPLPYVAAKPIVVEDAEEDDDDDSDESSEEYLDGGDHLEGLSHGGHGHSFAKGGGSDYGEQHHSAHGEKGGKGYKVQNHHAKGESGHYGKEHQEGHYDEAKGGKKGHHDEAAVHGKHYESGENYKGGDHGHKQHFSKGEDVTGYHKVFHKDEFKKDHDFYDVADNSGHYNKHGSEKGHHGSEKGGHKEGGQHDSAFDKGGYGKAGFHAKGHIDDNKLGHSAEAGNEAHYHQEGEHGKKGGSVQEKEYGYAEDDDDDYEDEDHE